MPISRLPEGGSFDPDSVNVLRMAFEQALLELGLTDRADPLTEMVARKIIEAAQHGERDPLRLREIALRSVRE